MKNKKYIYILLPIVIAIWSIIFYKILSENVEDVEIYRKIINETIPENLIAIDSFLILANYRDPFLNNEIKKAKIEKPIKSHTKLPTIPKTPEKNIIVVWPPIEFYGLVASKNEKLGFINVKNSQHLVKKGEIIEDIHIISFNRDSITVKYENETKSISKR